MSIDRLIQKIEEKQNPTVAGLDPNLAHIPEFIKKESFALFGETLKGAADAIYRFNTALMDALYDIVPAIKPQAAYYEMYGYPGVEALYKTIEYGHEKGFYVIADVKRNDIGTTAAAYSSGYLGVTRVGETEIAPFNADSVTLNPYMGIDSVQPFIDDCNQYQKSVFVLVKTSNKSSADLQDIKTEAGQLFLNAAELVHQWGKQSAGTCGYSNVGAVVGATYPEQAEILREKLPNSYFLVPGYGAQGAGAKEIKPCFNSDGKGALINSSRGIMCAYKKMGYDEHDFAKAAREEAIRMRDDIMSVIG